ncbi:MAG: hypothetical protein OK438_00470 [Thaumarchaeota archaeon]|nr:hypothetical protein [Nitrososphaerota archaeon]
MPGEQVKFHSSRRVRFGNKLYQVILSDRRILLYAQRGAIFKSDDIVTQKLEDLQGVKYSEQGIIGRRGTIRVQTFKTEMDLSGPALDIKALYQQMMQFM